jgi:predicted nucleotidyltransferase
VRSIARKLKLGIPSVKYGLDKLIKKKLIKSKKEGRNLKFYINYKNNLIIPSLYNIEYSRLLKLPKYVQDVVFDFLKILEDKPILTLIFGSYAIGDYTKQSDLDVLLVFNKIRGEIEKKAKIVADRYDIKLEPVYLSWEKFSAKFFNKKDKFMKQVKDNKILINGIEWWVLLENEAA